MTPLSAFFTDGAFSWPSPLSSNTTSLGAPPTSTPNAIFPPDRVLMETPAVVLAESPHTFSASAMHVGAFAPGAAAAALPGAAAEAPGAGAEASFAHPIVAEAARRIASEGSEEERVRMRPTVACFPRVFTTLSRRHEEHAEPRVLAKRK